MKISSPSLQQGGTFDALHTCNGENINPELSFENVPQETKSLVLVFVDEDAPAKPWVHWLVFNIPPSTRGCKEGQIPTGGVEGIANGGTHGYEGPCPRYFMGQHWYEFRLFALSKVLDLPPSSDRETVISEMNNHIVSSATLTGYMSGDGSAL